MPSKSAILFSKAKSFLGLSSARPLHYHLGRPNFGDDINPWFFRRLSEVPWGWSHVRRPHFLGIGSIAAKASGLSVVMGAGLIEPVPRTLLSKPAEIFSVRGELTAEAFGGSVAWLGDPLILLDLVLPAPARASDLRIGVVPHESMADRFIELLRGREELVVIDPRGDPAEVALRIARCTRVASQSLHGLIVADVYRVPGVWIAPAEGMVGGAFKFHDYFSTLERGRQPVSSRDFIASPHDFAYTIGTYRWDRQAYLRDFRARLAGGLS